MGKALEGKVAVITGAGGGIGANFADALGRAGASVVLADLSYTNAAEKAAAPLSTKAIQALAIGTDITSQASVASMASAAIDRFGGIDILVNCAALMAELPKGTTLVEYPLDLWERLLRVNVTGALLCSQAVVPSMKERGGGKIINISSAGAFPPMGAYGVSKLALVGLTTALATQLGKFKINVNAIAPGMISTDAGYRSRPPGMAEAMGVPLKAIGDPEDLCGALLFLASPASDWVTGQTLNVDGGWIRRI